MTPHQALALGVRLFVVWSVLVLLREAAALAITRPPLDAGLAAIVIGIYVLSAFVLLILWFFPKSIARGLLPVATDTPAPSSSHQMWFTVGTALLGLWFAASAITPLLRNILHLFIFRPALIDAEDLRSLRIGTLYFVAELALGLFLLFGAASIRKFVWWARNASPE